MLKDIQIDTIAYFSDPPGHQALKATLKAKYQQRKLQPVLKEINNNPALLNTYYALISSYKQAGLGLHPDHLYSYQNLHRMVDGNVDINQQTKNFLLWELDKFNVLYKTINTTRNNYADATKNSVK
jgi:hypothetical protein